MAFLFPTTFSSWPFFIERNKAHWGGSSESLFFSYHYHYIVCAWMTIETRATARDFHKMICLIVGFLLVLRIWLISMAMYVCMLYYVYDAIDIVSVYCSQYFLLLLLLFPHFLCSQKTQITVFLSDFMENWNTHKQEHVHSQYVQQIRSKQMCIQCLSYHAHWMQKFFDVFHW